MTATQQNFYKDEHFQRHFVFESEVFDKSVIQF